jgi:hypothetical protein
MFRVYKPKPKLAKIKAVKLTDDNIQELAAILRARVSIIDNVKVGLDVATFEGLKYFPLGVWIVQKDDNSLEQMSDEEFEDAYEVARNTGAQS